MKKKTVKRSAKRKGTVVAVSGGFDPLHIGHIRYIQEAKKLGDHLVVILNNDHWLRAKKGYSFMSENDRKEILESLSVVDEVILSGHTPNDSDRSVCRELQRIRPHVFANGGDRTPIDAKKETSSLNPEVSVCKELGITMVYSVGKGGKVRSSSELVATFKKYER